VRIISGEQKGLIIRAPANLPVRPTTDIAKESLFNILGTRFSIDELEVLDLFAGTGNISYEFCSRGVQKIKAIDKDEKCIRFIRQQKEKFGYTQLDVIKADVMSYLRNAHERFDLIFADPPYAMPGIAQIPQLIFGCHLLKPDGILIVEHGKELNLKTLPNFAEERNYGQSVFTFYKNPET